MRRRSTTRLAALALPLLAVACVLALAGCGGGSDDGSGETTATSDANERLTSEQWTAYQSAASDFADARQAAQEKVNSCPRSATGNLDVTEKCLGPSLDALQAASVALGETLTGFIGTVSGACAESLNAFTQYTTPFVASLEQLQRTLADDNVAGYANSVSSVQTALEGGTQEAESFERDCSPL